MKILIATTNPAKIISAKTILHELGHEGLSFADLKLELTEPDETKATAEEIAREKAIKYAEQYKSLPILARDDTVELVGVSEEDDPKNHNKEFVAARCGEYSDENGEKVFSEIAKKYGGEVPLIFSWGFALAWWNDSKMEVESGLAKAPAKLVSESSRKKTPGFCFAPVCKVQVGDVWKYDTELTDDERVEAYQNKQANAIENLLKKMNNNL